LKGLIIISYSIFLAPLGIYTKTTPQELIFEPKDKTSYEI